MLGWETIPAVVHQGDAHAVALMEIDENLIRKALTPLEEGEHLKRRKAIYEAIHPETKHGATGRGRPKEKSSHNENSISFAEDTAAKTGRSRPSIYRDLETADKITPAIATQLVGTKVAESKTELKRLASIVDEEERMAVAKQIGQGKAATVQEAAAQARVALGPVAAVAAETESIRDRVLRAVAQSGDRGATEGELAEATGLAIEQVRPRRVELVEAGLVAKTAQTRPSASGQAATVWRLGDHENRGRKEGEAPALEGKPQGKGIAKAYEAIDVLKSIRPSDPTRKRAMEIVANWIKANSRRM